jgi:ABC-2 type transport system ATP-binding protein
MRDRLAARLVAEKNAGGAVLLATHDPDLVRAVADTAVHVADDVTRVLSPAEAATLISSENP